MRLRKCRLVQAAAVCSLGVLSTSIARGGYTTINPATPPEMRIDQILDHIYSGTFIASGVDYNNGSITAHRLLDTQDGLGRGALPPATSLTYDSGSGSDPAPDATAQTVDQLWTADSVTAVAQARYAVYEQQFGFVEGATGNAYHSIFDISGSGFNVTGSGNFTNFSDQLFRFARTGVNARFTSQISDNSDNIDHMVTYRIDTQSSTGQGLGTGAVTTYLLFWEDKLPNDNPDYDYNDLVVEIQATNANSAPEPASIGLLALGGMSVLARRRRTNA